MLNFTTLFKFADCLGLRLEREGNKYQLIDADTGEVIRESNALDDVAAFLTNAILRRRKH